MICRLLAILMLTLGGTLVMAQAVSTLIPATRRTTVEELQKEIDILKKQKELVDAQKELLSSQNTLTDVQNPPANLKQLQEQSTAAKATKDVADAQKSLADARKAASESELAAFKAKWGEVTGSGIAGGAEMKDKAVLEAALLSSKAVNEIAGTIDRRVRGALFDNSKTNIAIFAGDLPNFQSLTGYKAQFEIVKQALTTALASSQQLESETFGAKEIVPPVGAVGLALDSINKVLSYFRTEYTVGGVDITLDDLLLVSAVSDLLRQERVAHPARAAKYYVVTVPGIYNPNAISTAATKIVDDLAALSRLRQSAAARVKYHDRQYERLTKQGQLDLAQRHQQMAADLKAATGVFDTWFTKISALDEKGAIPLVAVVREQSVYNQLGDGHLLLLKIQKAGGGYVVKKNLWTLFGKTPHNYTGGAAATYMLLNGQDGHVLVAGTLPVFGGLVNATELRRYLNAEAKPGIVE